MRSQDTGSASLVDAAPRIFSAVCRLGSSHRSVILLRVPKPFLPGQLGPVAREIASRFRDEQDPASSGEDRLGGRLPAPGQPRVAVHEDEDGGPDGETDHSDQPQRDGLGEDAADHEGGEQGDRDRVRSHGHRPPLGRPGGLLIRRGRLPSPRGRLPSPRGRLRTRRGVRHHNRHLLPQC